MSTHNDDLSLSAVTSKSSGRSFVPAYQWVKDAIREEIATVAWPLGTMIPSEPSLCTRFGVSRTTVRKAVGDLRQEGRLRTVQGKGTFVASPKVDERFIDRAIGLYEDLARRGIHLATQVLRQEVVPAPPEVAARLGVPAGEPTHVIVRLRSADGETMVVSTTYIPRHLCPTLTEDDLTSRSLYHLLRDRYGLALVRGVRRLEAIPAPSHEAKLLDVALSSPLLQLETVAYLRDGRAFEYSVALHRGDRTTVEVEFFASPEDALAGLALAAASGKPSAP